MQPQRTVRPGSLGTGGNTTALGMADPAARAYWAAREGSTGEPAQQLALTRTASAATSGARSTVATGAAVAGKAAEPSGGDQPTSAASGENPAEARKNERQAAMLKLHSLDNLLTTLGPETEEAFLERIKAERAKAAVALAETKPLGARVTAARKQLQKARMQVQAAEARARAAAEEVVRAQQRAQDAADEAARLLGNEHAAESNLDDLEKQVAAQKGGMNMAVHAQALMQKMD